MQPIQLFDPASSTYTYVIFDETTREAVIIDPVDEQLERDLATLRQYGLKLMWTVETHAHADHITSAGLLAPRPRHPRPAASPRQPCNWSTVTNCTLAARWSRECTHPATPLAA